MSENNHTPLLGGEGGELTQSLKTHPMPGWFSFVEIPGSEVKPELELPPESVRDMLADKMGVDFDELVTMAQSQAPGIMAALVMEVGKLPPGGEQMVPFEAGDTVYMQSDRGIPIGDYRFACVDKPISYVPAHEE